MQDSPLERKITEATAVFEQNVGVWDGESEIRPAPEAPPIRDKGVATNRRIAGGRWLVVDYRAESGFEGHGVYGWDASTGKYTGSWVDSMQTCVARSEGTWDPAARAMTFVTEANHGGQKLRYREVTTTQPDGSLLYQNLIPMPNGEEFEMVRITYRKRK